MVFAISVSNPSVQFVISDGIPVILIIMLDFPTANVYNLNREIARKGCGEMNYKERKRARLMYLLPMMLALTGLALLVLEWAVSFDDLNTLSELLFLLKSNWYIILLPVVLMVFYFIRIQPVGAYIGAGLAALLLLVQLIVAVLLGRNGGSATGLVAWVPGHGLFTSIGAARGGWGIGSGLALFANLCLVLSNFSAVFSCLYYVQVKRKSDRRLAAVSAAADRADADPDL